MTDRTCSTCRWMAGPECSNPHLERHGREFRPPTEDFGCNHHQSESRDAQLRLLRNALQSESWGDVLAITKEIQREALAHASVRPSDAAMRTLYNWGPQGKPEVKTFVYPEFGKPDLTVSFVDFGQAVELLRGEQDD